eukprot:9162-Heterococcus_DN1.PRE.2
MVQNRQLAAVATLAAIGAANGFFATPVINRSSAGTRVVAVRMAAINDPSANIRRAGEDLKQAGKDAVHKAENKVDQVAAKAGTDQRVAGGVEAREVIREAPIVRERIHEQITEVDKTRIEEERVRTEVVQCVQPIKDERRVKEDVKRVDHGLEVRETGKSGLDESALAELERRRQEVASGAGTTREAETTKISERPDVVKKSQTRVIEQVVPVIERDVYVPHRVENYKEVKEIIHEKPVLKETVVEPAITCAEFEAKYGKKVETVDAQQVSSGQQRPGDLRSSASSATNSSVSTKGSAPSANTASSTGSSSKAVHASSSSASSSASDAKRSAEKAASDKLQAAKSKLEGGADHSDDSYSMSSSNMAREAAEDDGSSGGSGLGAALKAPLKAAKNLVDKIID